MSSTAVRITVVSACLALSACAAADIHPTVSPSVAISRMAEFWEEPTDIPMRDLFNGPWGAEHAPDANATYRFLSKKQHGANPGMTVSDPQGREWHVKQGTEGPPEVVLSRVLAAIGYHQPPVYFLSSFTLADASGRQHSEPGGRFRLHDSSLKNRGEWSWDQNPFVSAQPYQGLLVILVMFNSADLKNNNNSIYELKTPQDPTQWFVVRDLGSSLGETGRFDPKEGDPDAFERNGFITGVKNGFVDFDYHAVHRSLVTGRIRPGDVRWASRLLAALTIGQWQDAFRAAGYTPPVADRFIRRLRDKIDVGQQLTVQGSLTSPISRTQRIMASDRSSR